MPLESLLNLQIGGERLVPCRHSYESGEVRPVNATVPVTVSRHHFRRVWAYLLSIGVKPTSNDYGFSLIKAEEIRNSVNST